MPAPRGRLRKAPTIELQPRDKNALLMLYYCDGLMSQDQLLQSCYPNTDRTNIRKRLLALFDNRYLDRNWEPEKWEAYPHLVYWLFGRGYDTVFATLAEKGYPFNPNTRSRYISQWRPITLMHHLQVNDVFLKVHADCEPRSHLRIGRWLGEAFFRSKQWNGRVQISDGTGRVITKPVLPDGFFTIHRWLDEDQKTLQVHSYILEVDRASEDQQASSKEGKVTIDEKLKKGAALVDSQAYRETFGLKTGRCLMVTTSWPRAENMMRLAREAGVSWAWYFSTYDAVTNAQANILTDLVWRKADLDDPQSIIDKGIRE